MKQINKYQQGKAFTLNLPGFKTKEQVNQINNREKQLAKHHFSSITKSEGIWDGIKHLGRGIQHAYNAYLDPATTYQTGTAPSPSFAKGATAIKSVKDLGRAAKSMISSGDDVAIVGMPSRSVPVGARVLAGKNGKKYFDESTGRWIDIIDDVDDDVKIVGQASRVAPKVSKPVPKYDDVQIVNEPSVPDYDYNNDVMMVNSAWDDAYNFDPGVFDMFKKGGKAHKPFGHRSILDNGWQSTKQLKNKKNVYGK